MNRATATGAAIFSALLGLSVSAQADSGLPQDSLESWGAIGLYYGHVGFEEGQVDVPRDYDRLVGVRLSAGLPLSHQIMGQFDLVEEMSVIEADDNDETRRSGMIAVHLNYVELGNYSFGAFAGAGRSKDNGDNLGESTTFGFVGLEGSIDTGPLTLGAQIGALTSDDLQGESYDNAKFMHVTADFHVMEATRVGGSFSYLRGDRWNDPAPNDNQGTITAFGLSLEHQLQVHPISIWAEFDRMSFDSEGESDDPWVNEFRVGLTYHFGGGNGPSGKASLPKINRWISIAANEIE